MTKRVHLSTVWLVKLDDHVFEAVVGTEEFAEGRLTYHFTQELEKNMHYWAENHKKFGLPDEKSVEETARRMRHWHVDQVKVEFEHRFRGVIYV